MNWKLFVLGVLVLGVVFISGSIQLVNVNQSCTIGPAPSQSLPIYGGVVYERTGPQTFVQVSQYLVYPPDSGYYSPEGSGVIYIAGVS